MIVKSFEINKINLKSLNFFLLYGENEGFKNQVIKKEFENKFKGEVQKYEEKEILNNESGFFDSLNSKSFFEKEKLIIINRCTDKIKNIIEEIIERDIGDIKIILNADILDKRSKLRAFFEKNKQTVCIPFYADNSQTLSTIINNFFREKKISISQQTINLLVDRCRGDRQNLNNELQKIESYIINKKNINPDEILKLTNLAENYNVSELIDGCLSKNLKKTINILNENNYSADDCILITRTLLIKLKRLFKIKKELEVTKNIDNVITSFKPPIFWKEKETVKQQISKWNLKQIENLIFETNNIELLIKKNSLNSLNILSDFIVSSSNN
ncbi:DNA polymerase III subunit delta [Candidatus Pelagibacter sp.]|nr:DNA polymerase III subunit delta [Candidatus Pelagibacter sp.]